MNGLVKASVVLAEQMILKSDYITREELRKLVRDYFKENGVVLNTDARQDKRLIHFVVKGAEYLAFDKVSYDNVFYYIQKSMQKRGVSLHLN